jgi:hypothetical protein
LPRCSEEAIKVDAIDRGVAEGPRTVISLLVGQRRSHKVVAGARQRRFAKSGLQRPQ